MTKILHGSAPASATVLNKEWSLEPLYLVLCVARLMISSIGKVEFPNVISNIFYPLATRFASLSLSLSLPECVSPVS